MRISLLAPWLLLACALPQVKGPRGPEARLDEVALARPPRTQLAIPAATPGTLHLRRPAHAHAPAGTGAPIRTGAPVRSGVPALPALGAPAELGERASPAAPDASPATPLTFFLVEDGSRVEDGRRPASPLRAALPRTTSARGASPRERAASGARIELEATLAQQASAAGPDGAAEPDLSLLDGHLTGGYPLLRDRGRFRASLVGGLRYVLIDPEREAGAEVGGELELVGPFVGLRFQF